MDQVRNWRSSRNDDMLLVAPSLPPEDVDALRAVIDDCISSRGGELAARRRATAIAAAFVELDDTGKKKFFRLLADEYDHDDGEVDTAIDRVRHASHPEERRTAERELAICLQPKYERLLRRFAGLDGGLQFLVDLREDLLPNRRADAAMLALDGELRSILEGWFDIALLELRRITWDSGAALLEKLIEYEAVHAIESWDDMRGRLGPLRRCYAYLHPMMTGEPLIFVEVALTKGIASSLTALLDHDAERRTDPSRVDTAIFYSISNCQTGLRGVSLGNFLIKRVVEELTNELPHLKNFATLSPIPGFRRWLLEQFDSDDGVVLDPAERSRVCPTNPEQAEAKLCELAALPEAPDQAELDVWKPVLLRLAAAHLVEARRGDRAAEPVAHFHLSNGALLDRVHWCGDQSDMGLQRSFGIMVNYVYEPEEIENRHEAYFAQGRVAASAPVQELAAALLGGKG